MRHFIIRAFSWQRGYGAFSVSRSNVASVVSYIEKQEEHSDSSDAQSDASAAQVTFRNTEL